MNLLPKTVTVAKIFGANLILHRSFSIYFAIVAGISCLNSPMLMLQVCSTLLVVYLCVILHEFGHIFAARKLGYSCEDIFILPFGCAAAIKGDWYENPRHELAIAVAGPFVTLVIFALSSFFDKEGVWYILAPINFWLLCYNAIPVFPMDGGRVGRVILSYFFDREKATKVACWLSVVIALVVSVYFFNYELFAPSIVVVLMSFAGFVEANSEKEAKIKKQRVIDQANRRTKYQQSLTYLSESEIEKEMKEYDAAIDYFERIRKYYIELNYEFSKKEIATPSSQENWEEYLDADDERRDQIVLGLFKEKSK